jgi:hypothetical protein
MTVKPNRRLSLSTTSAWSHVTEWSCSDRLKHLSIRFPNTGTATSAAIGENAAAAVIEFTPEK